MAVTVVDKDNFLDQAQGKEIASERVDEKDQPTERPRRGEPAKEAKADKDDAKVAATEPNETDLADEDYALLTEKQQRAVNKKHRAMKEADEFAEEQYRGRRVAEKRADEAESRLKALEEKGKPIPVEAKEPDPKDFTNDKGEFDAFGYAKALAKHSAEEAVKADREAQAKANKEATEAKAYQEYLGRVKASTKDIPDWTEAAEEAADMKVSGVLTGYLQEAETPGPLLYHLAKHPDVLDRLNGLSPIKAIAEITKLELSLTKPSKEVSEAEKAALTPKKPFANRAPEPIAPIGNGAAVIRDPRDMTIREHIDDEYREARESHSRRKRH